MSIPNNYVTTTCKSLSHQMAATGYDKKAFEKGKFQKKHTKMASNIWEEAPANSMVKCQCTVYCRVRQARPHGIRNFQLRLLSSAASGQPDYVLVWQNSDGNNKAEDWHSSLTLWILIIIIIINIHSRKWKSMNPLTFGLLSPPLRCLLSSESGAETIADSL